MYSLEHKNYLKQIRKSNILVWFTQVFVVLVFILLWEFTASSGIINPFIFSSPSRVIECLTNNNFTRHILVTLFETGLSFFLGTFIGLAVASLLWWNKIVARIMDPYLTVLNSLPKVALGPILIIWCGANINSIIIMALLISLFTSIINMYEGFKNTNPHMITLMRGFGASKFKILTRVVIPYNYSTIISTMKITCSMSLVGVIMGEMLVSKEGLGYLITYGSQVFNLSLVISSIFILAVLSFIIYKFILLFENKKRT